MPVIRVTSLPFEQPRDMPSVLKAASAALSRFFSIDEQHITLAWNYFRPHHYSVGGRISEYQPDNSHPILVDILVPDSNSHEDQNLIIHSVAEILSITADVPLDNIFVHLNTAFSGSVFANNEIVEWQSSAQPAPVPSTQRTTPERREVRERRTAMVPNAFRAERRNGFERRTRKEGRRTQAPGHASKCV